MANPERAKLEHDFRQHSSFMGDLRNCLGYEALGEFPNSSDARPQIWEGWMKWWKYQTLQHMPIGRHIRDTFINRTLSTLNMDSHQDQITLDLGCGNGHISEAVLLNLPGKIIGVDGSTSSLEGFQRRSMAWSAPLRKRALLYRAWVPPIPLEDKSVDNVVSSLFYQYQSLDEQEEIARECFRVQKDTGLTIVQTFVDRVPFKDVLHWKDEIAKSKGKALMIIPFIGTLKAFGREFNAGNMHHPKVNELVDAWREAGYKRVNIVDEIYDRGEKYDSGKRFSATLIASKS